MKKVTLSGYIIVPISELDTVKEALTEHIKLTKAELGCMVFEVTEHSTERGRFDVYEEFESSKAFELHQKRVRGSYWGEITQNLKREYTIDGLDD